MFELLYRRLILGRPWPFVLAFLALGAWGALQLPRFRLAAGTSTLVLEGDDSKRVYDDTRALFMSDDYVLVAFAHPRLWTPEGVALAAELTRELGEVEGITSVVSPTNVPLFLSDAQAPFVQRVLTDPEVDLEKARADLLASPIYRSQLISEDGRRLVLVAHFASADAEALRARHRELAARSAALGDADPALVAERDRAAADVLASAADERALHRRVVERVREILPRYRERGATVHASGLPTLMVDMVNYLEHDILVFGIAVAAFLLLTLFLLFRRPRFVLLPLLTCVITVVAVMGATVALGVETTVVTSNISSLLFIIGMAHSIHLVVKYREERAEHPERAYRESLLESVRAIWEPCLYTALTTCVGFASLLTVDVGPVKEFALAMAGGTLLAFVVSLVFLPAALAVLPPTVERASDATAAARNRALATLAEIAVRRRGWVYGGAALVAVAAGWGIALVKVDTRFVDYFRSDTEVHQGIEFIDQVGGTMTLEVILFGDRPGYWLEEPNYERIAAVHEWFEGREEVGKTLSLVSFREEGRRLLAASPMPFAARAPLAPMMKLFERFVGPEGVRKATASIVSPDFATTRVYVRLRETAPGGIDRIALLEGVRRLVAEDPRLAAEREKPADGAPVVTGMFQLFTNMLNTLVGSQVRSFGWVFLAVASMLALLFRHVGAGLLAMPPNLLPIALVLGTMGFAGVPLDLMTIMVASVSLGIAVDSSIHYVVRFRRELRDGPDHAAAARRAHLSIGRAILFTAITVFAGFFVLVFSKFTPTIWFGVLTGVAMVAALLANLVLLPALILSVRLFRREVREAREAREAPEAGDL